MGNVGSNNGLKFIIFAHPRSGSSSLTEILKLHPDLSILVEPFSERFHLWFPLEKKYRDFVRDETSLDELLAEISLKHNGVKTLHFHLPEDLGRHMLLKPDYRIIFLRRENLLQAVVSVLIAEQTRLWKKWELDRPIDKVYANVKALQIDDIRDRIEALDRSLAFFGDVISSRPPSSQLKLTYEGLFCRRPDRRAASLAGVFRFLGLEPPDDERVQIYLDPKKAKMIPS